MPLKPCSDCLVGKQHKVSFHRSHCFRRSHMLDLVYTDVCFMCDRTLSGALYFATFIDDHSIKVWAFALRFKDHVLDVFKHFHTSVDREKRRQFKSICADNGGEYKGPFENYCNEHDIKLEKAIPKACQKMELLRG